MRGDVHDVIDVIPDEEMKAPILVDASLPETQAFVVLFGAERRVPQIPLQELDLLEKRLGHAGRKAFQRFVGAFGLAGLHRERLAFGAVALLLSRAFM